VRTIAYDTVVDAVGNLCMRAATQLPVDVVDSLRKSLALEQSPRGKAVIEQCIENAVCAASGNDPVCQDTGVAVYFVAMGNEVAIAGGTITDALNEGTHRGYTNGYLRKSIVRDPLFDRKNTGDNTPAMVHLDIVPGETITITLLPKGGGSENMSALAMLKPSQGSAGVVDFVTNTVVQAGGNPCPPVIVGVGIGGVADHAMQLAKRALLRPLGTPHCDERYAHLEREILRRINASGVGPQGLGGTVTALAVHIEEAPCHLASLPVGVALQCHAARRGTVVL
jgi:fumarate hydratase subunit alpha